MGHHFDSPTSLEDPRIDPTDFFAFGSPDGQSTVFVLNVNPDAGRNVAAEFRPEALYEVKVDTNGDLTEDLSFRFSFGEPSPTGQSMSVTYGSGTDAVTMAVDETVPGLVVGSGATGAQVELSVGGRVWAGHAADPFFANFFAHGAFIGGLMKDGMFRPEVFTDPHLHDGKPANSFESRNVMSIVLEVPNTLLDTRDIQAWATISLYGHLPQQQVSRMANPVIVFYFGGGADPEKLTWLRGHPRDDRRVFSESATKFVTQAATAGGRASNPARYAEMVVEELLPDVLTFRVGSFASYGFAGRNGRYLTDDAVDLQLTTITNVPVTEGLKPAPRVRAEFPFVGEPYDVNHAQTLFDATH
jgi:Domain of unknown function (DUF4331)